MFAGEEVEVGVLVNILVGRGLVGAVVSGFGGCGGLVLFGFEGLAVVGVAVRFAEFVARAGAVRIVVIVEFALELRVADVGCFWTVEDYCR